MRPADRQSAPAPVALSRAGAAPHENRSESWFRRRGAPVPTLPSLELPTRRTCLVAARIFEGTKVLEFYTSNSSSKIYTMRFIHDRRHFVSKFVDAATDFQQSLINIRVLSTVIKNYTAFNSNY
jgi:hypothetical protein